MQRNTVHDTVYIMIAVFPFFPDRKSQINFGKCFFRNHFLSSNLYFFYYIILFMLSFESRISNSSVSNILVVNIFYFYYNLVERIFSM